MLLTLYIPLTRFINPSMNLFIIILSFGFCGECIFAYLTSAHLVHVATRNISRSPTFAPLRQKSNQPTTHFLSPTMASFLGANYDSSSDDEKKPDTTFTSATKLVAAPEVNVEVWSRHHSTTAIAHSQAIIFLRDIIYLTIICLYRIRLDYS